MRNNTPKRAAQIRLYNKAREEYMEDNNCCEICSGTQIVLHHKKGRRGERLMDKNFFMSVCNFCHNIIHTRPEWSYEKGYLIKG